MTNTMKTCYKCGSDDIYHDPGYDLFDYFRCLDCGFMILEENLFLLDEIAGLKKLLKEKDDD